ncbi:MAG: hypothetical protein L3J41_13655 [Melioribacteraceae bacterium]|nr:hypothetical protein [Melioribacteraceae bacterium]
MTHNSIKILKTISNLIVLLVLSSSLFAQNENDAVRLAVPGIITDARSLGLGNSNMTRSGDYSAMLFNPAGLALSTTSQLSGSFYYRYFQNQSTFFGNNASYKNSSTELNQLGYLYKAPTTRGSLVYGFGYQKDKDFSSSLSFNGFNPNNNSMIQDLTDKNDDVPYLLGLSYPLFLNDEEYLGDTTVIKGRLGQSGEILEEGGVSRFSFGAGVELAEGVYIGGSINYLSGDYRNDRKYYEDDNNNYYQEQTDIGDPNTVDFQTFFFNDEISWNMSAWEYRFGFIIDWLDFIRVGGSTKLPTTFRIKENYYFEAYSQFDRNYFIDILPTDSRVEYEIRTPLEFSLGVSIDLRLFHINAQATFIDYSQMKFSGNLDQSIIRENNRVINSYFKGVLNYNLGAELKIPFTEIRARAGIMYYTSPYIDDPQNFDRVYLTAGAGIMAGNALKFDVAYSYGFWDTYSDNYGTNQSRVFQEISSHTILITTTIMY